MNKIEMILEIESICTDTLANRHDEMYDMKYGLDKIKDIIAEYTACQDEDKDKIKIDVKEFVKRFIKSYGDETFPETADIMASMSNGSSINIPVFFEELLEDYIEEINGNSQLPNPPNK